MNAVAREIDFNMVLSNVFDLVCDTNGSTRVSPGTPVLYYDAANNEYKGSALDSNGDGSINIRLADSRMLRSVRRTYIGCVTGYLPLWSR